MIYIAIKCESNKTVFKLVFMYRYIQNLIQFEIVITTFVIHNSYSLLSRILTNSFYRQYYILMEIKPSCFHKILTMPVWSVFLMKQSNIWDCFWKMCNIYRISMSEQALKFSCGPHPMQLVPLSAVPQLLAATYVHWSYR